LRDRPGLPRRTAQARSDVGRRLFPQATQCGTQRRAAALGVANQSSGKRQRRDIVIQQQVVVVRGRGGTRHAALLAPSEVRAANYPRTDLPVSNHSDIELAFPCADGASDCLRRRGIRQKIHAPYTEW
jgi:hypothetical protein